MSSVRMVSNLNAVEIRITSGIREHLLEAGFHMRNALVKALQAPPARTGHIYDTYFFTIGSGAGREIRPIGHRWKPHQASAPGEMPAKDTGDLQRSMAAQIPKYTPDGLGGHVTVISPNKVGWWLERGTDRIKPRPWFKPTWEKEKAEVLAIVGGQEWF